MLIKGMGTEFFSSDMTAFTDVFPIELETNLVNTAWPGLGDAWKQVMSDRYFDHPLGKVKYMSGNPMGVLSSWPISSFTHHAVKAYCATKCGVKGYKYLLLGDDNLDTNQEVSKLYFKVMSELGVQASLSKCTSSKSGYTEFAKRLFGPIEELTGLPVDLLADLKSKPEQFLELIRIARERGYRDNNLKPGITSLISKHKEAEILANMLALPESASGMPPLLEVKPDS